MVMHDGRGVTIFKWGLGDRSVPMTHIPKTHRERDERPQFMNFIR
jgi:hypothetical protein